MTLVGLRKITGRGVMSHMGARAQGDAPARGVYRFTTEDLGDYFELGTMGKVNELTRVIRAS